ncbi:MAG: acylase [Pseudomonadota bacterium]
MRFLKWSLLVILIIAVEAATWLWNPHGKNPDQNELASAAERYNVEIIRDDWGVPHIFGTTDADTAFGVAFAHAEDDYQTIQEVVAATRGHLASYRGAGAAPTDYLIALLDVWGTIDARYANDVPGEVKALAEAYAAGLNLYAAQNPDSTWPGLAPFTDEDVIAGFIFKTPLFYGLDETLLDLFGDERSAQVALDPHGKREAWHVSPKSATGRGSNAFAVAPARSGDGTTRLLINSHQPMTGPVAWWEAHLVSEEGLDITGGLFPGTPVILHGFNRDLGWANTVNKPDLVDVYRLTINPENDRQYRLDGTWRDFEVETARIRVRLWGPFAFSARREVLRSVHGPIIAAEHGTYALRYAGMGEIRQLEQYYRLNKARDHREFMEAMAMNALPSINYVYADRSGTVGFVHNGQYPARDEAWDWSGDLPGDRSDLIWEGYRPFSAMPTLINPASGFIYNANNTPFSSTDGPDNLRADAFPRSMGLEVEETNRSLRIMELTGEGQPIDRSRLLAIKFDTAFAEGSVADTVVAAVLAEDWSGDGRLEAAARHLAAWDRTMDADNRHAALGGLTVLRAVTEPLTGIEAPPPAEAFRDAVDYLHTHHGRIDPPWGELNRLVRGELSLPLDGGPDTLRAIYPAEMRDDGELHAVAGDTWIALVEWDADGSIVSDVVHQFGAATLDESSPHYSDQAPLFAARQWRRALLERADIEAAASRTYRPTDFGPD